MMILYTAGLIGVAVFAVSGALEAGRKHFDWLGVVVIAFVTAVGGGTLRDLLLDQHIFWIRDTTYVYVVLVSAAVTLVYVRFRDPPQTSLAIADALGLALFTIGGAQIAESQHLPPIIVIFMGTITGAFGGVVRDVLCGDVPILLRPSELYATTSIVGASFYLLLQELSVAPNTATLTGMTAIAVFRIAAIFWKLRLPVFRVTDGQDSKPR